MSIRQLIKDNYILLTILSLSLFLRIYHLGSESIWGDEGYSIVTAKLNLSQIIQETILRDTSPSYHFTLHYWIKVFGDSEFCVRLLSTIFGFFAVVMIYKVGSLIFNKNIGLLSSLLLGLSVCHIKYAQETRAYTLMTLLTLLSIYFFIKLINRTSLRVAMGYIISTSLLVYTHPYGLWMVVVENIYLVTLLLLSKEKYKLNFPAWILFQIILSISWILFQINQILRIQEKSSMWVWPPKPTILSIIETFGFYSSYSIILLLFFSILAFFSILSYEKTNGKFKWRWFFNSTEGYSSDVSLSYVNKIYLLLLWLSIPNILPWIISQFLTPIYNDRYTISASLAFYILIANSINKIDHKFIKLISLILIITFSLAHAGIYYSRFCKPQWREAVNYVEINAKKGDLILFNDGTKQKYCFDYYAKRTDLIKKPFPERIGLELWEGAVVDGESIKKLYPTVKGYNRVWLVLSSSSDEKGLIKKTLSQSYKLSKHKEYVSTRLSNKKYVGIDITLFTKNRKNSF